MTVNPHQVTIDKAISIIGVNRVITAAQARKVFNLDDDTPSLFETSVSYTEETLSECATENERKEARWRLVYTLPLSFREQYDRIGTDKDRRGELYFSAPTDYIVGHCWWLGESEASWVGSKPLAGYHLIDMQGVLQSRTNWHQKTDAIALLGEQFECVDERVFLQALASLFKIHPGEWAHVSRWHWGRLETSSGERVYVGLNGDGQLTVNSSDPSIPTEIIGMHTTRKFEC